VQRRSWLVFASLGLVAVLFGTWLWTVEPPPLDPPDPVARRQAVVAELDRTPRIAPTEPIAQQRPPMQVDPPMQREVTANHPPLNDGNAWQNQRAAAAIALHRQQLAATETWAAEQQLGTHDTTEITAAIDGLHTLLRTLKAQVEEGDLPPAELRVRSPALRAQAASRIEAAIGTQATEALRAVLAVELGGGF
jgi:hypothetical protein